MQADTRVNANPMTDGNRPVKRFRAGAVAATVWENEAVTKDGARTSFYTVSLDRAYKDKDGDWRHSGSFRINDLPRASLALNKAYEWLALQDQSI